MTELYIIRHGQTDYNKKGIVQGSGVDSELNEKGIAQAKAFYSYYKHLSFDQVYCSTLKRTEQTLAPWLEAGYNCEKHPGLNEFHWGVHEGTRPTKDAYEEYIGLVNAWKGGKLDAKVPGGESPVEAWARAKPFFDTIGQNHHGHKLLICSHGRQIRVIFNQLLGLDMEDPVLSPHKNTALNILVVDEGRYQAKLLNNTLHLGIPTTQ